MSIAYAGGYPLFVTAADSDEQRIIRIKYPVLQPESIAVQVYRNQKIINLEYGSQYSVKVGKQRYDTTVTINEGALQNGDLVCIYRASKVGQPVAYTERGVLSIEVLEQSLDLLTLFVQEQVYNTFKASAIALTENPDLTLPPMDKADGKVLGFKNDETGKLRVEYMEVGGDRQDIVNRLEFLQEEIVGLGHDVTAMKREVHRSIRKKVTLPIGAPWDIDPSDFAGKAIGISPTTLAPTPMEISAGGGGTDNRWHETQISGAEHVLTPSELFQGILTGKVYLDPEGDSFVTQSGVVLVGSTANNEYGVALLKGTGGNDPTPSKLKWFIQTDANTYCEIYVDFSQQPPDLRYKTTSGEGEQKKTREGSIPLGADIANAMTAVLNQSISKSTTSPSWHITDTTPFKGGKAIGIGDDDSLVPITIPAPVDTSKWDETEVNGQKVLKPKDANIMGFASGWPGTGTGTWLSSVGLSIQNAAVQSRSDTIGGTQFKNFDAYGNHSASIEYDSGKLSYSKSTDAVGLDAEIARKCDIPTVPPASENYWQYTDYAPSTEANGKPKAALNYLSPVQGGRTIYSKTGVTVETTGPDGSGVYIETNQLRFSNWGPGPTDGDLFTIIWQGGNMHLCNDKQGDVPDAEKTPLLNRGQILDLLSNYNPGGGVAAYTGPTFPHRSMSSHVANACSLFTQVQSDPVGNVIHLNRTTLFKGGNMTRALTDYDILGAGRQSKLPIKYWTAPKRRHHHRALAVNDSKSTLYSLDDSDNLDGFTADDSVPSSFLLNNMGCTVLDSARSGRGALLASRSTNYVLADNGKGPGSDPNITLFKFSPDLQQYLFSSYLLANIEKESKVTTMKLIDDKTFDNYPVLLFMISSDTEHYLFKESAQQNYVFSMPSITSVLYSNLHKMLIFTRCGGKYGCIVYRMSISDLTTAPTVSNGRCLKILHMKGIAPNKDEKKYLMMFIKNKVGGNLLEIWFSEKGSPESFYSLRARCSRDQTLSTALIRKDGIDLLFQNGEVVSTGIPASSCQSLSCIYYSGGSAGLSAAIVQQSWWTKFTGTACCRRVVQYRGKLYVLSQQGDRLDLRELDISIKDSKFVLNSCKSFEMPKGFRASRAVRNLNVNEAGVFIRVDKNGVLRSNETKADDYKLNYYKQSLGSVLRCGGLLFSRDNGFVECSRTRVVS